MTELTPGSKIAVFVPDDDEPEKRIKYSSTLEGFGDNKRLIIKSPVTATNSRVPIRQGQILGLQCVLSTAIVDFDATVLHRIEKGPLSYLLMEQKTEFKRTQRRQDFRMECMKDGRLEYDDPVSGKSKTLEILLSDISGGGASVRSPSPFGIGANVKVHLPIGKNDSIISYECTVRRCFEIKEGTAQLRYNVGLQFHFRTVREKEDLISIIFKMQRERKK
jgi:c-di-GMP-binding flagellar brake protein YcgR